MQLCKYYPVANDRMGSIWTLCSIKDTCIIEFGPAGTTHYAVEGIGSLNAGEGSRIYSTHMDQSDVTFGKYDRLEKAILEVDENIKPRYIFVMASSISSIIGADIESVCSDLQSQVQSKLIAITTGGLKHQYHIGVEQTLELLVKKLVGDYPRDVNKYNILGCTIDKYNYASDVEEMKRMMKLFFNKEVQTVFTCETTVEEIEQASRASLNIVMRKEALKAAKWMKKTYGIPYIYHHVYGLQNTIDFIEAVNKIDGYEVNREYLNAEVEAVKKHLFSLKRKFLFYKETKECAIFGDYDTVLGFDAILKELGLATDRLEVLYQTEVEADWISGRPELERIKYLKSKELFMICGDGPSLEMEHQAKVELQVSNPNLNQVLIYPYTPYMGFRGMLFVIEKILNIK
ncbi:MULTISPECIES: nitrogenase component 1 [Turicibacter]|uniref:nitrogenase component 1 n=1 Tax=Turicibacter TaxID=191303 RepID=UPI0011CAA732|nr:MULTISPECIES: nitrogenase component 1 [Turicibacter]MBP3905017.1 nitrogenase component 1 [Turicibacter sp.]MTL74668.1 oxidoreductase [Turicibacter sanguinis]